MLIALFFVSLIHVQISPINSLPNELLFEILQILPADLLYQKASYVCRKWHKLIRSEDFINAQIRSSSSGLLLSSDIHSHPIYVTAEQGRIQTQELSYKWRTNTLDSCNGLLLEFHLHNLDNITTTCLHLINPATNQLFLLPPVPITSEGEFYGYACNIAYSAASMEYKVTLPYFGEHDGMAYCAGLLILTVGVDKSWRDVPIPQLPDDHRSLLVLTHALSTEGFLHWAGWGKVLTFNVETETFTCSEVPKLYRWYWGISTGRNLSVLCRRKALVWEIWELKAESGEWRNLLPLNVDLRPLKCRLRVRGQPFGSGHVGCLRPLGWVKYPEVLAFCFGKEGHTCIFYNLYTREIDTIELPDTNKGYRAFPHRNNLVGLS